MLYSVLICISALLTIATATVQSVPLITAPSLAKGRKSSFKDFIQKYEPSTLWEQLDRMKTERKRNLTTEEELDFLIKGIDPAEEVLRLNVVNGNPTVPLKPSRRFWTPEKGTIKDEGDPWQVNRRLLELMKQTIYQTRNKMVIMQKIRDRYKSSGLYKMGFLIARADERAKLFASVSYKALNHCTLKHHYPQLSKIKLYFPDIIFTIERNLHIWFELDLLYEFILKNDKIGQGVVSKYSKKKRQRFSEQFIY